MRRPSQSKSSRASGKHWCQLELDDHQRKYYEAYEEQKQQEILRSEADQDAGTNNADPIDPMLVMHDNP